MMDLCMFENFEMDLRVSALAARGGEDNVFDVFMCELFVFV